VTHIPLEIALNSTETALDGETADSNEEANNTSRWFYWGERCQTCVDLWRADPRATTKMPPRLKSARRVRNTRKCVRCMVREHQIEMALEVGDEELFEQVSHEYKEYKGFFADKRARKMLMDGPGDQDTVDTLTGRLTEQYIKAISKPGGDQTYYILEGSCLGCMIRDGVAPRVTVWRVAKRSEGKRLQATTSGAGHCVRCRSSKVEPFCSRKMPVIGPDQPLVPQVRPGGRWGLLAPRLGDLMYKESKTGAFIEEGGCEHCSPDAKFKASRVYEGRDAVGGCVICAGKGLKKNDHE